MEPNLDCKSGVFRTLWAVSPVKSRQMSIKKFKDFDTFTKIA